MIIYAVQYVAIEGILEQEFYMKEQTAKDACCRANKQQGYDNFVVVRIEVNEE